MAKAKTAPTIPPTSWPMVNIEDGTPTVDWWNFFYSENVKLGGPNDSTLAGVAAAADAAQKTADTALTDAQIAETRALAAAVVANTANTTANNALAVATAAGSSAGSISAVALTKGNNLSDVASVATARLNLGLAFVGSTAGRPGAPYLGQMYFDTSLSRPIWWSGGSWIKADGTVV